MFLQCFLKFILEYSLTLTDPAGILLGQTTDNSTLRATEQCYKIKRRRQGEKKGHATIQLSGWLLYGPVLKMHVISDCDPNLNSNILYELSLSALMLRMKKATTKKAVWLKMDKEYKQKRLKHSLIGLDWSEINNVPIFLGEVLPSISGFFRPSVRPSFRPSVRRKFWNARFCQSPLACQFP